MINNKIKFSFVSLLLFISLSQTFGQVNGKKDAPLEVTSVPKLKALAKNALKIGDAYTALYYYEKLHIERPNDYATLVHLADLYKVTRDYPRAAQAYDKVYHHKSNELPLPLFEKAIMQKMSGNYFLIKFIKKD